MYIYIGVGNKTKASHANSNFGGANFVLINTFNSLRATETYMGDNLLIWINHMPRK